MTSALLDEVVRAAVRDARHAPSSHNAQPWQAVIAGSPEARAALMTLGDDVLVEKNTAFIVVALDPARCLSALPAHRIEMLVSAGAYLESLFVALDAGGLAVSVVWRSGDEGAEKLSALTPGWEPVALVAARRGSGPVTEASLRRRTLLAMRRTHRGAYRRDPIAPSALASLSDAASLAFPGSRDLCELVLLTDAGVRATVGHLLREHGAIEFTHAAAWAETYAHIRFDDSVLAGDGLPIEALLAKPLPHWQKRLLATALSPGAMRALAPLGLARAITAATAQNIAASPLLVYLRFRANDPPPSACLAGGALVQSVWLALAEHGLVLHPVSVLLQHDTLRATLDGRIGQNGGRGFFLARAGSPVDTSCPFAPRRVLEPRRA
ncbi:nitroreductase family protein [Pendulispora albinea]|uniref:Nitroreductase family protein n=1 Tax=Pendulispora albinea TaxID=2741071 RepID=A0ABZ2M6X4_9BACT